MCEVEYYHSAPSRNGGGFLFIINTNSVNYLFFSIIRFTLAVTNHRNHDRCTVYIGIILGVHRRARGCSRDY